MVIFYYFDSRRSAQHCFLVNARERMLAADTTSFAMFLVTLWKNKLGCGWEDGKTKAAWSNEDDALLMKRVVELGTADGKWVGAAGIRKDRQRMQNQVSFILSFVIIHASCVSLFRWKRVVDER